jgi:phenylacetate-CoA ligase
VPPGEEGRILVTSLANYAMPLIRYEIGDRGALAPAPACPCGRIGQILQAVSGRLSDNFRTASGKVIPGEYFIHLLGVVLNSGSIERFQVIQHDYDAVTVKIVQAKNLNHIPTQEIEDKIKVVMGQSCAVAVELVDDIPPSASGKYLYTVSEVPS